MADMPNRLPAPLSQRLFGATQTLLSRSGKEVDVAIGGIPFLLAASPELPMSIETIPLRKEQVDTEVEPGEQSLTNWWRRSQESWHEGAGNLYQEARGGDAVSVDGFYDSHGIDPFSTRGELKLLPALDLVASSTGYSRLRSHGGGVSAVKSGQLYTGSNTGTLASLHAPASKTVVDGMVSGSYFYDVTSDGTFYEGQTASPGTATSWPLGAAATRMAFGKHRPWVIGGRNIWQPDLSLTGGTAQTAIFTHPNQGWTYTCIAEGPQAMYFGGDDGFSSSIQAITIEADGGIPTLAGAQVTVALPDGEIVNEIAPLAGQYIGIGTNRGFRVGIFDGTGITYGPLLFEPEDVQRCTALTSYGRYFLVGFECTGGTAELWRVDVSQELSDGVFPYCRDAEAGPGYVTSATRLSDDRLALTDDSGQIWEHSTTDLVEIGDITMGRIRFRTNEKKLFKYVEVDTAPLAGTLVIEGINDADTSFPIDTFSTPGVSGTPAVSLSDSVGPQRYISLKFTLTRDASDPSKGPVIRSYLLRAMPSVRPQRLITLPLLCFDREQGRSGMRYGYDGYAADRLTALQAFEDSADTMIYQDFGLLENTGKVVVIESLRFVQTAPNYRKEASGQGGIIILELRTVTA